MKTKFFFSVLACMLISLMQMNAKNIFVIEGPEETYNQIRVINETSQSDFQCRIVVLKEDETTDRVYGVYDLKGFGDTCAKTARVTRGTKIAIQVPKSFPGEVSCSLEYKDFPLFFDAIVVHLNDEQTEFKED